MSKRRDRHQRGLRGPLAMRSSLTGTIAPVRRRQPSAAFFLDCVGDAIERVRRDCPDAISGIAVGVEEVPGISTVWSDERVPLAAALERTDDAPPQVVLYRRPLEHRAATRRGLAILSYRALVEQLSALTGLDISTIDPSGRAQDED